MFDGERHGRKFRVLWTAMDSRKPTPDYNFSIAMKYHYKFAVKILYTIFIQLEVYLYRIRNPDLVDHMCPTTHIG